MRVTLNFNSLFALTGCFAVGSAALAAPAAPLETLHLILQNRPIELLRDNKRGILVGSTCLDKTGQFRCKAYQSLGRASLRGTEELNFGGKNPGSLACQKLGAKVVIATLASNGTEYSLCEFEDQSLIDTGTLALYARMNDSVKKPTSN